jgi:hypothetical protein
MYMWIDCSRRRLRGLRSHPNAKVRDLSHDQSVSRSRSLDLMTPLSCLLMTVFVYAEELFGAVFFPKVIFENLVQKRSNSGATHSKAASSVRAGRRSAQQKPKRNKSRRRLPTGLSGASRHVQQLSQSICEGRFHWHGAGGSACALTSSRWTA